MDLGIRQVVQLANEPAGAESARRRRGPLGGHLAGNQRLDESQTRRKTLLGVLRQSAVDNQLIVRRHALQVGHFLQMLEGELAGVLAGEGRFAGQQFAVGDGQLY